MATFREVFTLAQAFLGDRRGISFKEGTIMPQLTEAHRMVQRRLAENGIGTMFKDVSLTVPANTTAINLPITPSAAVELPSDLVVPHNFKEKQGGQAGLYQPMERRDQGLPSTIPAPLLRVWRWINNGVELLGSTRVVDVVLTYEKMLPDVAVLTDTVLVRTGVGAVAHATAFLVNGTHYEQFNAACDEIIASEVRSSQTQGMRRIPYGRAWR